MSHALAVLPVYNEADNLERVVAGVRATGCDVLIVDDNSPDGSGRIAESLRERDGGVTVLHRPGKLGLGTAYVAGFQRGLERGYPLLLEVDADGSHNPLHIPALIEAASQSGGLAIGSRYVAGGAIHGWGLRRLALSRAANLYARLLLDLDIHDCTSGFRCYTRRALGAVRLETVRSQGYSFQIEMAVRCLMAGLDVVEVPIVFEDRVAGKSKVSRAEISRAVASVVQLRVAGYSARRRRAFTTS